jgi:pyruvate dehydrogenase E2 component (dihydrolipoamide acetyltransferase)
MEKVATAVGDLREDLPGMGHMAPRVPATAADIAPTEATSARAAAAASAPLAAQPSEFFAEKPLATPATRKLARDLGLDLHRIRPTGPGGRVTSDDVRAAERRPVAPPRPVSERTAAPAADIILPPAATPAAAVSATGDRRIPLRGTRKRIFEGMARSKRTLAHATFVEECDVTELKRIRERLKPAAMQSGVNLTFLPFIVKAVVAALKKHPALNATFDETTNEIVERGEYNIGVAAATDAGLVVPVVHHADKLSLLGVGREIERMAADARAGKSKLEDLQGGTFTLTSLGQQSGLFATPVIHFPEAAILGIHQMKRRPVVRGDQIVIGEVMLLSLSFDHRLIDGNVAAAFTYEVIGNLETPEKLLLDAV